MKNKTIVSLADSNYFDLLNELVDSILKFSESKELDKPEKELESELLFESKTIWKSPFHIFGLVNAYIPLNNIIIGVTKKIILFCLKTEEKK